MINIIIPSLISIPSGSFYIGSTLDDPLTKRNEQPQRKMDLPTFNIGKYPITNSQYADFIHDNKGYPIPLHWGSASPPGELLNHPVINVSNEDASSYCDWLSEQTGAAFTLPTEIQWEMAARGVDDARRYVWGNEWKPDCCNTAEFQIIGTTPVTYFENINKSPFGVIDMLGNVWEWTSSWYKAYPNSEYKSSNFGEEYKIARGGCYRYPHKHARITTRARYKRDSQQNNVGFRIVTANPVEQISDSLPFTSSTISEKEDNHESQIDLSAISRSELFTIISTYFNKSELRMLCFHSDIDYENIQKDTKSSTAIAIIEYFERHKHIDELIAICFGLRPNKFNNILQK